MPEKTAQIFVDFDKITWVLVNFLTNAVKYSPSHSQVTIRVSQEDENICFEVIDQGRGVAPEDQDKIFDRYYRVQGSKEKGTGLGLNISKEIIEQM